MEKDDVVDGFRFREEDNPKLWLELARNTLNLLRKRKAQEKDETKKAEIQKEIDDMHDSRTVPVQKLQGITLQEATDLTGLEKCVHCKNLRICTSADLSTIQPMPSVTQVEMLLGDGVDVDILADKFPNIETLSIVQGYTKGENNEMVPISLEGEVTPIAVDIAQDYVQKVLSDPEQLKKEFGEILQEYAASMRLDGSDDPRLIAILRERLVKERLASMYLKSIKIDSLRKLKKLKKINIDMLDYIEKLDLNQYDNYAYGMGENTVASPFVFNANFAPEVEPSFELINLIKNSDKNTKFTPLEFIDMINKCSEEEQAQLFEYIEENDFTDMGPQFEGVGNTQQMLKLYVDMKAQTDFLCSQNMDSSEKINAMYQWMLSNIEYDAKPKDPSDISGAFYSGKANIEGVRDILNMMLATQKIDLSIVRMKQLSPMPLSEEQDKDLSYHLAVGIQVNKEERAAYFNPQNTIKNERLLDNDQLMELMQKNIIPQKKIESLSIQDRIFLSKLYQDRMLKRCRDNGKYLNDAQVRAGEESDERAM